VPASDHKAGQHRGARRGVGFVRLAFAGGETQRLFQRQLHAVVELVHAQLQAFVFIDQRIADQHPRHARILRREVEQHGDDVARLRQAVAVAVGDLVNQAEHALLDELDQSLEHLRLAGEMPVQAASENSSLRASAAVVILSPLGCSSISASACRICKRRWPGGVLAI
jgi:hypothetical protein